MFDKGQKQSSTLSCDSSYLSYVPLKTKFENLVFKISQKELKLEPSYLVHLLGLRSR